MPPKRHKDDVFTDEQFRALVTHPKVSAEMRLVMWIGFETGMRLGEILNMTWDRIYLAEDVARRGMRLCELHSKTGKSIVLPLSDNLLALLRKAKSLAAVRSISPRNEKLVDISKKRASAQFSALAKSMG